MNLDDILLDLVEQINTRDVVKQFEINQLISNGCFGELKSHLINEYAQFENALLISKKTELSPHQFNILQQNIENIDKKQLNVVEFTFFIIKQYFLRNYA